MLTPRMVRSTCAAAAIVWSGGSSLRIVKSSPTIETFTELFLLVIARLPSRAAGGGIASGRGAASCASSRRRAGASTRGSRARALRRQAPLPRFFTAPGATSLRCASASCARRRHAAISSPSVRISCSSSCSASTSGRSLSDTEFSVEGLDHLVAPARDLLLLESAFRMAQRQSPRDGPHPVGHARAAEFARATRGSRAVRRSRRA